MNVIGEARVRTMVRVAVTALMAITWVGCHSDGGGPSPIPPRFTALAAAVEAERIALQVPGVAVAVVEKGEVTFAKGFGSKDETAAAPAPVEPTTLFRIGSTQKALTTIALLQTVQAGAVDLDRPVVEVIPAFHLTLTPEPVAAITPRHLLTHTSGLHDYLEIAAPADESTDAALADFLTGRYAGVGYVQSPPGAFYAYSNPGFMLAGLLAETVTGVPYRTLVTERVLAPLGMDRTLFLPSEVIADGDYAVGRTCDPADMNCGNPPGVGPVVRPDSYDNPWGRPAGYAWSSVLDMAKLATFLVHGNEQVLGNELATAMVSPQVSMPETAGRTAYGFGVVTAPGILLPPSPGAPVSYYPLKLIGHDGALAGYSANVSCLPEVDFCFITLASGDRAPFTSSLVTAIQTLVTLPAPTTAPDTAPRLDRLDAYAGTYVDPFALGTVQITRAGNSLSVVAPTLDPVNPIPLTPVGLDNFAAPDGTPVTFIPDATGAYTYVYSRPYVAVRAP